LLSSRISGTAALMNEAVALQPSRQAVVCRPAVETPFNVAVQMVADALTTAHQQHVPRMLADISALTSTAPSFSECYDSVERWAAAAKGRVCLAVVIDPEQIEPRKFAGIIAWNRGFQADVFSSENEALKWLNQSTASVPSESLPISGSSS
jgi:hypothetical protein